MVDFFTILFDIAFFTMANFTIDLLGDENIQDIYNVLDDCSLIFRLDGSAGATLDGLHTPSSTDANAVVLHVGAYDLDDYLYSHGMLKFYSVIIL